jgi:hypothetical protein
MGDDVKGCQELLSRDARPVLADRDEIQQEGNQLITSIFAPLAPCFREISSLLVFDSASRSPNHRCGLLK